jgi:predicted HTH transcriptional regulator
MTLNSFFTKDFEDVQYSDIQALVINEVRESYIVDYKEDYPKQLAKVLISFANASGGFAILGIKEVRENGKNTGIPKEILGISREDHKIKITNIVVSHSQPVIIPKVKVFQIPGIDKDLVLIKIDESFEPIMETNKRIFPIRINDQSLPADYSIVKKLFNKETYQVQKRIQKNYNIIKEFFNAMKIVSKQKVPHKQAYQICLKQLDYGDLEAHQKTKREIFEFQNVLLIFKDDLKYFGANDFTPISFYFNRYTIKQNGFVECLEGFIPENDQDLFPQILNDIKEFSKRYFSIDLN